MSTSSTTGGAPPTGPDLSSPAARHDFFLRRLHSLTGVVPIGVFLMMHLTTNSLILLSFGSEDHYQAAVNQIHALGPFLKPVSLLFIMAPIAFHALLGLKIWWESKPNVGNYGFWCNWRYTTQRITGVIVLVFILVHLWHMSWVFGWIPGIGGSLFNAHVASPTAAHAMQSHWWWTAPLYGIGIVAACFHFGTGLWTFLITWGVTVGVQAQRRAGVFCAGIATLLCLVGLSAKVGMLVYPHPEPKQSHEQGGEPAEAHDAPMVWTLPEMPAPASGDVTT